MPSQGHELVEILLEQKGVRLEAIHSNESRSPDGFWYDQPEGEWVVVLRGQGVLLFEDGRRVTLHPGEHLFIPPHERHRVEETTKETLWLALFVSEDPINS